MSFSSAEWTIPELCVWIVTQSRPAVNGLSPSERGSLTYSDMVHGGAYAARDEVIEAAQQGKIVITCAGEADRYQSNPERIKLSPDFWNNAELEDATHWMAPGSYECVARRIEQPNKVKEFRDLLVGADECKRNWPSAPVLPVVAETKARQDAASEDKGTRAARPAHRPRSWDWDGALIYLAAKASLVDGLPTVQADAERMVKKYFGDRNDGNHPADSAIREKVGKIYREAEAEKERQDQAKQRRRTP